LGAGDVLTAADAQSVEACRSATVERHPTTNANLWRGKAADSANLYNKRKGGRRHVGRPFLHFDPAQFARSAHLSRFALHTGLSHGAKIALPIKGRFLRAQYEPSHTICPRHYAKSD